MKIGDDVLEVLSTAEISGFGVRLAGQIDHKLYQRVAKVLEAAGAKWSRKDGMHMFDSSVAMPADKLEQAMLTGEITTRQDTDFFETPPVIIDAMMFAAAIQPRHEVLEPSAGAGAIAAVIKGVEHRRLVCVERDADRVEMLKVRFGERGVFPAANFLVLTPADIGSFDRIVMNPPFSGQMDIHHIRHAYTFLKPGGRIVAIASAGILFRQNALTKDFRAWLDECGDYDVHRLPEGSFKSSGTAVNTVMITIDRG